MKIYLMSLHITLFMIRILYDGYIYFEMENAVYTEICKDIFWMDPIDPFFYECYLVVNLYNVEFAFQLIACFPLFVER
jgi:hypothetical protein